jgi:hypothetical protein
MSTSNAARQITKCQEIPIKLSEISNLFKEEQSGSRDAVDVDWTKT